MPLTSQRFRFEGVEYSITIEEVAVFPQGYAALMTETGLLQDEPSMYIRKQWKKPGTKVTNLRKLVSRLTRLTSGPTPDWDTGVSPVVLI